MAVTSRLLDGIPRWAFAVSGLAYALYLPASYYATSGMEAPLFALLVLVVSLGALATTAGWSRTANAATIAIVLARPEGIAVGAAAHLVAFLLKRREGLSYRSNLAGGLLAGATLAGLTAFRLARFGFALPNAYYAKGTGAALMHLRYGLSYVLRWGLNYEWIATGALLGLWWAWSRRRGRWRSGQLWYLAMSVAVLAYVAYIAKVGGDEPSAFPMWRHFAHIGGLLMLEASVGFALVAESLGSSAQLAIVVLLSVVSLFGNLREPKDGVQDNARTLLTQPSRLFEDHENDFVRWFEAHATPDSRIAARTVGRLGYELPDVPITDILSLNDSQSAHHGQFNAAGPIDSKTDMAYVLAQRPAFVDVGLSSEQLLKGATRSEVGYPARHDLAVLLDDTSFSTDYLLVTNGPYAYWDRAIFIRRDYWAHHPNCGDLAVLPVSQTALGRN